jgi:hypothetical protein
LFQRQLCHYQGHILFIRQGNRSRPMTVTVRSKAWDVFAHSNTGIVGSNPTRGMDVCVRLFCVCFVLCAGSGLATGWCPVQGVLQTVWKLKKLKKRPGFNKGLQSHSGMNEWIIPGFTSLFWSIFLTHWKHLELVKTICSKKHYLMMSWQYQSQNQNSYMRMRKFLYLSTLLWGCWRLW